MPKSKSSDPEVMSASEVRQNFGEVVNRVARGEGRVIVEKHGAPAVGLVSMEDVRRLRTRDGEIEARKRFVDEFREPFKDTPDDELEAEIEKALAEVREDRRQERLAREMSTDRILARGVGE
jgi:prevent-host-death family protein